MLFPLAKPLLFQLDPERAHRLSLAGLQSLPSRKPARHDPALLGHAHAAFGADFLKRFRQIVHRERTGG